jgi:hypothetical protein
MKVLFSLPRQTKTQPNLRSPKYTKKQTEKLKTEETTHKLQKHATPDIRESKKRFCIIPTATPAYFTATQSPIHAPVREKEISPNSNSKRNKLEAKNKTHLKP